MFLPSPHPPVCCPLLGRWGDLAPPCSASMNHHEVLPLRLLWLPIDSELSPTLYILLSSQCYIALIFLLLNYTYPLCTLLLATCCWLLAAAFEQHIPFTLLVLLFLAANNPTSSAVTMFRNLWYHFGADCHSTVLSKGFFGVHLGYSLTHTLFGKRRTCACHISCCRPNSSGIEEPCQSHPLTEGTKTS